MIAWVFIYILIYHNMIMPVFYLPYCQVSNSAFLQSTPVLHLQNVVLPLTIRAPPSARDQQITKCHEESFDGKGRLPFEILPSVPQ